MYFTITEKDYLAAEILLCLRHGINITSEQCAESADAPSAIKTEHEEPVEVPEQAAGPTSKPKSCNRRNLILKYRLRDLKSNNKCKKRANGRVPFGTRKTVEDMAYQLILDIFNTKKPE